MGTSAASPFSRPLRSVWPWVGLALGVALTLLAWSRVRQEEQLRLNDLKRVQAEAMIERLNQRMHAFQQMLRGASEFLGRGPLPTRAEWRAYVKRLELQATYPGIQGLGFSEWVPRAERDSHVQRIRREGFPAYDVVPGGPLPMDPEGASSIIYLEPMDARNQRAFGRDMLAEAVRREALVRARDTGLPALSGKVTLYQESGVEVQTGTLLFVPVYHPGTPLDTVLQRRGALRGWAYFAFRMGDLVRATLAGDLLQEDFDLYDGAKEDPAGQLFDSDKDFPAAPDERPILRTFEVAGRTWTARVRPLPTFYTAIGRSNHLEVLVGGLTVSLLLFLLLSWQFGSERRTRLLADQREEELRHSEARFRALFEMNLAIKLIIDPASGAILDANPAAEAFYGWSREELLRMRIQDINTLSEAEVKEEMARALLDRKAYFQFVHRLATGGTRDVEVWSSPIDQGGRSLLVSIVHDITDRVRLERALAKREEDFRLLADNAKDVIYSYRLLPEAGFEYISPSMVAMTGYSPEEFYDDPALAWNIIHPEDLLRAQAAMEAEEDGVGPFRFRWIRKDGRVIWSEQVVTYRRDAAGRALALQGVAREVTREMESWQALQQSEARLRLLGDQLQDSFVYQFGRDQAGAARFHYLSAGVERLCGVRAEDVLRDPLLLLGQMDPAQMSAYQEAEDRCAQEGTPFVMDLRQQIPGGQWRWFRVRSTPRRTSGGDLLWEGISTDITAQVEAEQTLQESERRYRLVTESAGDVIWLLDLGSGRFEYVSPSVERLRGMTPEQVLAEPMDAALTPASADKVRELLSERIPRFRPEDPATHTFTDEVDQVRRDGSVVPTEVVTRYLPDAEGRPAKVLGVTRDITERKRAQEKVDRLLQEQAIILENANVGISLVVDRRQAWLNKWFVDTFQYTAEEMAGQSTRFLYASDEAYQRLGREAYPSLARGETHISVQELVRKDGRHLWVRYNGKAVDPADPAKGILWILEDVTEARRAESALRESEARFRGVVDNAADAIYLHDAEGRIELCNPQACRSTGYTREELLAMTVGELDPSAQERRDDLLWPSLRPGAQASFQARHRRKDGSCFPVEVHLGVLGEGQDRRILALVRDLSEREQAQETEMRARKAESLVLMAGGIAHDFNNLFQALLANLDVAGLRAKENPPVVQALDRAKEVLRRAVGLSWKMLDFSGRSFVNPEALDLEAWLRSFHEQLRAGLPPEVLLDLDCGPVPPVLADQAKLRQVLRAAVDNALEALGEGGGRVVLRLFVDFGEEEGDEAQGVWPVEPPAGPATVCLEVADDGPGVPPDRLGLVCDPFYTTREPGRGLGLSAAVGILSAHGAGLHLFNADKGGFVLRMHFLPSGAADPG